MIRRWEAGVVAQEKVVGGYRFVLDLVQVGCAAVVLVIVGPQTVPG